MHESPGVMCTAQDKDNYTMFEDQCHDLQYRKLCYCITHRNDKVTAGKHQYLSNSQQIINVLRLVISSEWNKIHVSAYL